MDPRLRHLLTTRLGAFSAAEARAAGLEPDEVERAVRRGEVVRVRRAAYVGGTAFREALPDDRYRLVVRAVARSRPGDVVSHHAALALHRLPLWRADLRRVDLLSDTRQAVRRAGVFVHPAAATEVTTVDGVPVVPVPRAVVRTTLTMGYECGLAAADAALHLELTTRADLEREVARVTPHEGRRRALRVVADADPDCESVGETRTRILLRLLGFTVVSQVRLSDAKGFLGRVDFLVAGRVVVEFDGLVKYEGFEGREALAAEKRREDRIRALGHPVVRLVWSDLDDPVEILARIAAAQQQAAA